MLISVKTRDDLQNVNVGDTVTKADLALIQYIDDVLVSPLWKEGSDPSQMKYQGQNDVNIQDQHTNRISLFLGEILDTLVSISGTAKDVSIFNIITTGLTPVDGDYICLQELGKITQTEIINVVPVSGDEYTITIDVPLDFDYTSIAGCTIQNVEMGKDFSGSDGIFQVGPKGDFRWDITRQMVSMVLATKGDDGLFGDLTKLENSQYFRKENGITSQNLFTVKENSDYAAEGFDLRYPDRSGGQGEFGMSARVSYNGPDKSGVVIRLDGATNDNYRTVIRSDLQLLGRYRIKIQGHVVQD